MRVRPRMLVNGSITVSWPICTSTSITVARGSTMSTPARLGVVDPQPQPLVVRRVGRDRASFLPQPHEHVWQVALALRVVRAQVRERLAQGARLERVDAGVDLRYLELLRGGVALALGLHHSRHS